MLNMFSYQLVLIGFFTFTIFALIISGCISYHQFGCCPPRQYFPPSTTTFSETSSTPSAPELDIESPSVDMVNINRQIVNDALYYGLDNADHVFDRCHLVLNDLPPAYDAIYKQWLVFITVLDLLSVLLFTSYWNYIIKSDYTVALYVVAFSVQQVIIVLWSAWLWLCLLLVKQLCFTISDHKLLSQYSNIRRNYAVLSRVLSV